MPPIFHVNAFTDRPFAGNPAAVCLLDVRAEDAWMQQVGAQMNLSETAFLLPEAGGWRLRWFTPTVEVELCGHATLASAHVLWETGRLPPDRPARFLTLSGELTANRRGPEIELDFPALSSEPCQAPPGLTDALGAAARQVRRNRMDYLVELESGAAVRGLRPDHARLAALPVRGVIVTAASDARPFDFVSRFFAPGSGIAEDPVTGSSHCCLGPFWAKRLGKSELRAFQASARGGELSVRLAGGRVLLGGRAVTVLRGELCV
jgi:predicted PhzF superfamily epimerase YddE/YHI9